MYSIPNNLSNQLTAADLIKGLNKQQSFALVEWQYTKSDAYFALLTEMPVVIFLGIFAYFLILCSLYVLADKTLANQVMLYLPPYIFIAVICAAAYTKHLFKKVATHNIVLDMPQKLLRHDIDSNNESKQISTSFNELILVRLYESGSETSGSSNSLRIGKAPENIALQQLRYPFGVEVYSDSRYNEYGGINIVTEAFIANTNIKFYDFSNR